MKKRKLLLVGGARPNFMKLSPLIRELKRNQKTFSFKIIHTQQHYDYLMSEIFFRELEIPRPDYFLGAKALSHVKQTAEIMVAFERVCLKESPDLVIVVGDVNSTLAASLVTKKLGIKLAHIEAGLRSYNMQMPEEINRIVTDYLFVTEESAVYNLRKEGRNNKQIFFVGNIMIDNLYYSLRKLKTIDKSNMVSYEIKNKFPSYAILTLHRPSNVDCKDVLSFLIEKVSLLSKEIPILFPVHPRAMKTMNKFKIIPKNNLILLDPMGFLDFANLMRDARFVLTDSGGIQEETTVLNIPCFTLREETERPVTIKQGTNMIIGDDIIKLNKYVRKVLEGKGKRRNKIPRFWDGNTAKRIVKALTKIYD